MFRVRLATGDEKTYRTIDDMIWDVETGVITPDARLFHVASQSWVSVRRNPRLAARLKAEPRPGEVPLEFDPLPDVILADAIVETDEARRVREQERLRDDLHGGPSLGLTSNADIFASLQGTAPPTRAPEPPGPGALPARPEPAAPPRPEPPAVEGLMRSTPMVDVPPPPPPPSSLPEPPLDGDLAPLPGEELDEAPIEYKPADWKPERDYRSLVRVAVRVLVAAVLVGLGAYTWMLWREQAAASAAAARDTMVMRRQAVDTIPDSVLNAAVALMEEAETTDAEVLLKRRLGRRDAAAAAAPRRAISGVRAMTAAELRRSYTMAYAEARGRMDSTLAAAGVRALFAPERLATADSLRAGRRIVVAARNVARAYNRTEVQVERAFRDTVAYQVGRMGWGAAEQAEWGARAALKETYEGTQLTDSLLTSVDRIYGLLLTQRGRYDLGPEGILFSDPKAANEYARHAQWLAARIDRFAQADDQARWPTARRIVAAFQGTRPPVLLQGALGS